MAVFSLRGWDLTTRIIIPHPRAPTASGPKVSQSSSNPRPQANPTLDSGGGLMLLKMEIKPTDPIHPFTAAWGWFFQKS